MHTFLGVRGTGRTHLRFRMKCHRSASSTSISLQGVEYSFMLGDCANSLVLVIFSFLTWTDCTLIRFVVTPNILLLACQYGQFLMFVCSAMLSPNVPGPEPVSLHNPVAFDSQSTNPAIDGCGGWYRTKSELLQRCRFNQVRCTCCAHWLP